MKTLFRKKFKKLIYAALFAYFACNGLQAMHFLQETDPLLELSNYDKHQARTFIQKLKCKLLPFSNDYPPQLNPHVFNSIFSNISLFPNDLLNLIILETLKNGIKPNEIASTSQRFKILTQNIIQNICNQVEDKIRINDTDFDQWFNQFHKNAQNIIKKRLNLIAKGYVNTLTEEELNNLPNTIFKRIFVNKWFYLKNQIPQTKIKRFIAKASFWKKNPNQRFLDNTLPTNFNVQMFNNEINNINDINLSLHFIESIRLISIVETLKFIIRINNHNLNLYSMNINDEILELILEIIIENGLTKKITSLLLFNNQLNSLSERFGNLEKLNRLWITNNELTTETKVWLREKYGNIKDLKLDQ